MPKEPTQSLLFGWRKHLAVHPAAELFPLMSDAELKELAAASRRTGCATVSSCGRTATRSCCW
jgi:hypothetical protein